jgi:hypothetical protein
MIRCALCGSSRLDAEGVRCARCGGSPAVRGEQCYISEDTKTKLLAHAEDLKAFGVSLERQQIVRKHAGTVMTAIGLALGIAESLHPGALRALIRYLRDLAIPEEEIIRLRLDEPEKVSKMLRSRASGDKRKKSSPAGRKRAAKRSKG